MYEVIRWISLVMCWVATGMNIYAMIRLNRTRTQLELSRVRCEEITQAYVVARRDYEDLRNKLILKYGLRTSMKENNNETDAL
jgi:hypothetical protein